MTDFPTSNSRRKRKVKIAWLPIGCVLVAIWSLGFAIWLDAGSSGTQTLALDILRAVGLGFAGAMAGAVVVAAVIWLADGRDAGKGLMRLGVLAMVALVASVPLVGLKAMVSGYANEEKAILAMRDKVEGRRDALLAKVDEERDAILAGGFMEPEALARPGGIARARGKIEELRVLARRSQAEDLASARQARAEIEQLPASSARRAEMLRGFDMAFNAAEGETREELELAMSMFDEMEGQLNVLSRQPRAWAPQYGTIGFNRQSDLNAFNAHAVRIRDISQLLEAMERRREARQAAAARNAGF